MEKEASIVGRENMIMRVESGHHRANEEKSRDILPTGLLDPRLLAPTTSENLVAVFFFPFCNTKLII